MSKISNTDRNRVKFAAKNRNRRHRRDVVRTPVTTHRPGNPAVFTAMAQAARKAAQEQADWEAQMDAFFGEEQSFPGWES